MAELINLNRARKRRAKDAGKAKAGENRVAFGRTKAERELAKARTEQAARTLDGKKRED
jgi:hypothetical protein